MCSHSGAIGHAIMWPVPHWGWPDDGIIFLDTFNSMWNKVLFFASQPSLDNIFFIDGKWIIHLDEIPEGLLHLFILSYWRENFEGQSWKA